MWLKKKIFATVQRFDAATTQIKSNNVNHQLKCAKMLTHREMWHTNFVECHANRANAKWNEENTHLSFKLISWKIIDWIIYSIHFHQVQFRQSYILLFVLLREFIQIFTLLYWTVKSAFWRRNMKTIFLFSENTIQIRKDSVFQAYRSRIWTFWAAVNE